MLSILALSMEWARGRAAPKMESAAVKNALHAFFTTALSIFGAAEPRAHSIERARILSIRHSLKNGSVT